MNGDKKTTDLGEILKNVEDLVKSHHLNKNDKKIEDKAPPENKNKSQFK